MSEFRPTHSLPFKVCAVILLMLTLFATVLSAIGIGFSAVYGLYDGVDIEELRAELTEDYLYKAGYQSVKYLNDSHEDMAEEYLSSVDGLYYEVVREDGTILYSNYRGQSSLAQAAFEYVVHKYRYDENGYDRYDPAEPSIGEPAVTPDSALVSAPEDTVAGEPNTEGIASSTDLSTDEASGESLGESFGESSLESAGDTTISYTVSVRLWGTDQVLSGWYLAAFRFLSLLSRYPVTTIITCAASLLISVVMIIYLLSAAGHHRGEDGVRESPFDRIPSDVFTCGIGLLEALLVGLFVDGVLPQATDIFSLFVFLTVLVYIPFYLLLVGFFMSLATRIKTGRLLRHSLVWIILSGIWRFLCFLGRKCRSAIRAMPMAQRTVLWVAILFWVNLIVGIMSHATGSGVLYFLLALLEIIAVGIYTIWHTVSLRRLQTGIHRLAKGELTYQIDTQGLNHDCHAAAEDLNHIGAGLSRAVDERVKSEHFKTELITNVSHDIKTPLTSIINYVDLIKKQQPEDETLRSYVEVLDRQSNRLKKLIEDLVEASKASSGVLAVSLVPCELGVLLEQTEGEYAERLAARELTLIVTRPKAPLTIMADGRHLGRIFDNLLSNICKYAQPGTRVYLDAAEHDGQAVITFRNTSGAPLNIPAEELMERFVRGDTSRHTEGSGLGLSIVQSLTELQGGHMELIIDGDLFKVMLTFPAQPEEAPR